MQLLDHPAGGYRFLTGISPYSSAVVAAPGYAIVRMQLATPLPYPDGFAALAAHLAGQGRPLHALCAVELRIPTPLSFAGFAALNGDYQTLLAARGLLLDGRNPIARTNVAPAAAAPGEAVLYAFAYTVPVTAAAPAPTFVVAGAGDLADQTDLRPGAIVRPGDTSPAGLCAKAAAVMEVMAARLTGLGVAWNDVTTVNLYTVHPPAGYFAAEVQPRLERAALHGVHWYCSRPPIAGLEYEMDLRRVWRDGLLD
jgi:hypothetical protein